MISRKRMCVAALALFVAVPTALASSTWYVDGVHGSDNNDCKSAQHACKTIGHAISMASSGDSIMVAAATYTENLSIGVSLKVIGSGAATTIIDGGGVSTVVKIPNTASHVTVSKLTIRNGVAQQGGGIFNNGTLTINNSTISGNRAVAPCKKCNGFGGGIFNNGTLAINNSTISGNSAAGVLGGGGGGISNGGTLSISTSTVSLNQGAAGAGIYNAGILTTNNSTISGNSGSWGGGISNGGRLRINNSTLSGNSADHNGGGIYNQRGSAVSLNSVIANSPGGNCGGNAVTSNGYNLSSDGTCNFNSTGDLNNTAPVLGPLQNNGGPTQTQALLSGSPAIDAGNPSGCTDGNGNLLKTDQRGKPRHDKEDTSGCDMGAYERQSD